MEKEKVRIAPAWRDLLAPAFALPAFDQVAAFVKDAYRHKPVYPPASAIFRAFDLCPLDKLKVVILGQDPYHGAGQADGLCFSVPPGKLLPPSLQNIFKEIARDLRQPLPADGDLSRWAVQGVLLLNATLTVGAHEPGSHQRKGWEEFTDTVIKLIAESKSHLVFLLWGAYAQQKQALIDSFRHLVLTAPHPSPYSANRGFFGCSHFSQANAYLQAYSQEPVAW